MLQYSEIDREQHSHRRIFPMCTTLRGKRSRHQVCCTGVIVPNPFLHKENDHSGLRKCLVISQSCLPSSFHCTELHYRFIINRFIINHSLNNFLQQELVTYCVYNTKFYFLLPVDEFFKKNWHIIKI